MIIAGGESLREVIPFPKTARAVDLMVDAPSHIEQPQEDQLELMSAWPGLTTQDWHIAHLCDELISHIEDEFLAGPLPADTPEQRAMSFILARALDDAHAAVRLAKGGYGVQAGAVCRALLEGAINAAYIAGDQRERAIAFMETVKHEAARLARTMHAHGQLANHPLVQEALRLPHRGNWPKTVSERLEKAGQMASSFRLVFGMLSSLVHPSVTVFASRLEQTSESQLQVQIGRGREGVQLALFSVFVALSQVGTFAFGVLGFDAEALARLVGRFEQVAPLTQEERDILADRVLNQ
jgi:hypothetical protein